MLIVTVCLPVNHLLCHLLRRGNRLNHHHLPHDAALYCRLLTSELVANAVLHAGTRIRVVLRIRGQRLRVEVHDGNARLPAQKHYSAMSATGRGLLMVERMSDDWGVAPAAGGKSVWFELDSTAAPAPPQVAAFDFGAFDVDDLDDVPAERRAGEGRDDPADGRAFGGPRALVGRG